MNWRSQCGFGIGDWGSGMSPCTHHAAQPMEPRPKAREEETGCGSAELITYPFSLASDDSGSDSYLLPAPRFAGVLEFRVCVYIHLS